jgi:acyl-CoA reductase-like NAD-dependent aldehyde dehydrogenase
VASKSFDNSILCTNESVLIVEESVADRLAKAMTKQGAYFLDEEQVDKVREVIFEQDHFNTAWVGKSAVEIAAAAGIKVPKGTLILVAPFDLVVPEQLLAHEKLCPVLGWVTVPNARRGIRTAMAVLRITGSGHSAAIHSEDADTIMEYAGSVPVLRVSVNVGNSLGSAGIETNLAPTMTIGTGFFGRSSVGENLQPKHLVNCTRIATNADARVPMADFVGRNPWRPPRSPVPAYPLASNAADAAPITPRTNDSLSVEGTDELRDEIRRMVIEELRQIIKG